MGPLACQGRTQIHKHGNQQSKLSTRELGQATMTQCQDRDTRAPAHTQIYAEIATYYQGNC